MAMNPRLLRPIASGFNPKSVGTLAVWYDAANTASLTYNGSTISQWNDSSGSGVSGRNLVQSTAGSQPGTTTVNGRNALTFNGTSQWMRQSALSAYAHRTSFVVWSYNGTNGPAGGIYGYRQSASAISGVSNSDTFFFLRHGPSNNSEIGMDSPSGIAPTARVLGAAATISATANFTYSFNPSPVANTNQLTLVSVQTNNSADGNKMCLVGVEGNGTSRTCGMTFCELLLYSQELGLSARQRVERYLAAKWGLTLA
jgi:hypothetical protein